MIREALSSIDYGFFAVVALLLFAVAFGMIVIRTFTTGQNILNEQAEIPLSDGIRSENDE